MMVRDSGLLFWATL